MVDANKLDFSAPPSLFQGPPNLTQPSPFDNFTEADHKRFDKALAIADGIQMYHKSGGMGAAAHWKPYAVDLAKQGGLPPEAALMLSRYRMWKEGVTPPTERKPEPTPEMISARGQKFVGADLPTRARLSQEVNNEEINSMQGRYDSLVMKKPEPAEQPQGTVTPGEPTIEPKKRPETM